MVLTEGPRRWAGTRTVSRSAFSCGCQEVLLRNYRKTLLFYYTGFKQQNIMSLWTNQKFRDCKGVRCPPIFSLSNLVNAGWLVRKCVNIYIHPLIAGTNRKAFCCMLALRWRTVTASDHPLLILLWSNNWCLNIYILMNCHNGHRLKAILTNEDKERLVTWPCWDIDDTVELVETTIRW